MGEPTTRRTDMTGQDWINSVWPYVYIIGITVALSINWMWNRVDEDREEAKDRHPSRSVYGDR
jgi:fucose permease